MTAAHVVERQRMDVEVELVRASLVRKLAESGVELPKGAVEAIAESVLDDAVRLALDWIEGFDRGW